MKLTLLPTLDIDKLIEQSRRLKYVILDVGGEHFKIERKILSKYPATRLGKIMRAEKLETILEYCDEVKFSTDVKSKRCPQFYFDKNPDSFNMILDMYRAEQFHVMESGLVKIQYSKNCILFWLSHNHYSTIVNNVDLKKYTDTNRQNHPLDVYFITHAYTIININ